MAKDFKACSVDGCNSPATSRGLCQKHYSRWYRFGSTELPPRVKRPPKTKKERPNYGKAKVFALESAATTSRGECIEWPFFKLPSGYGIVRVGSSHVPAHRFVCEAAYGPPPAAGYEAAHECGNRACCNPHHLSWKTPKDNRADKLMHGTHNRGDRNPRAKLTADDVAKIRIMISQGVCGRKIAAAFAVSPATISLIKNRVNWGWLG